MDKPESRKSKTSLLISENEKLRNHIMRLEDLLCKELKIDEQFKRQRLDAYLNGGDDETT